MSDELRDLFLRLHNKMRDESWIIGRLGRLNSDGTYTIPVEGKPGWVHVRLGIDGKLGNQIALDRGALRHPNLRIRMLRENGRLVVYGAALGGSYQTGGRALLPPHADTHGRLGSDPLYVTGLAFLPLAVTPSTPAAMTVAVQGPAFYRYEGTEKVWTTDDSSDLSAYVPSGSLVQHFVVISLDRANNTLVVTDGTDKAALATTVPFTAAEVLDVVETLADAYYPLAAVRFYYGQTTIRPPDIFMDLRLWGGEPGSGTGGFDSDAIMVDVDGAIMVDADGNVMIEA